ncbi:hypothetical protein DL93DRAFT_2079031 [Clavulina sp. PMI_390]|nr:hypothetical protein DL93DRAFT_2079031 [Clavulina sp. PMI_390]
MNPRLEPALRSQYLTVPPPVPAQTTGDSDTSASSSAHNSTRYWHFSPQSIFRRSPAMHSSPFSPSDESPELTDGGGLVEVQNNGLSTEDTTLGTSTLMGLFRKRSSRLHAHSTRGENRAQAVKPTLEDTIRCKLGKNSPVTQDYEMHATLDAHGGIPQHDAQGFEHHLEHFRAKNGDYSAAQRSKARQGGNKENEFQFITSQQGEHTAQNEDCDRQQPNSQPPYAHPYGKVKLEENVQDATTRFEARIKIEPPSNDDLYAEALVHDLYGSQPEEKVEAEYDYEDIAGLPPTIEDDSVQPHPRVHEKRPRRRLSKIRRDRGMSW